MFEVILFSTLAILVGLGLTFVGYAAFRFLLPILAFLAGFWLGMDLATNFAMNFPFMGFSLGFILGLVIGAVFAFIAYAVYAIAIVIAGVALGYALGAGLMVAIFGMDNGIMAFITGVAGAVLLGYLFVKGNMPQLYIMIITAGAGASALIAGFMALFGRIPPNQLGLAFIDPLIAQSFFWIIAWLIIATIGIVAQMQSVKMAESMVPQNYSYDATVKEYKKKAKKEAAEA